MKQDWTDFWYLAIWAEVELAKKMGTFLQNKLFIKMIETENIFDEVVLQFWCSNKIIVLAKIKLVFDLQIDSETKKNANGELLMA